jgi:hypothetical protein
MEDRHSPALSQPPKPILRACCAAAEEEGSGELRHMKYGVRGRRTHPGPGRMSFTIKITDEPNKAHRSSRSYSASGSRVQVIRRTPEADPVVEALLAGYAYGGRSLIEVWPVSNGVSHDSEITEMVVSALTLGRLGYEKVTLERRRPPNPDIFADSEQSGSLAIEVTLNVDPDERAFQAAVRDFVDVLNHYIVGSSTAFTNDVNIGVVALPRRREYAALAGALLKQIEPNLGKLGKYEFSDDLSGTFAQYILCPRGNGPPITAGGVVNVRGHADLLATTMERIIQKRDRMDYHNEGRGLWLVVGMALPLIGPDVLGEIYEMDLPLGKFDRIVLSDAADVVVFARSSTAPGNFAE